MSQVLTYLDLPETYKPSPLTEPLKFLALHIQSLPTSVLKDSFGLRTTPSQRNAIPLIRNRRLRYLHLHPDCIKPPPPPTPTARPGQKDAEEEEAWAKTAEFLGGTKGLVGKLSGLLGEYEEERGAEEARRIRREAKTNGLRHVNEEDEFVPEEDSDSDDEIDDRESTKSLKEQLLRGSLEVKRFLNTNMACVVHC